MSSFAAKEKHGAKKRVVKAGNSYKKKVGELEKCEGSRVGGQRV
jgi:hypothetical protein